MNISPSFLGPWQLRLWQLWRSTLVKTHGRWFKETWQFWLWPSPLAFAFGRQPAFESLHLSIYMQVAKEFDTVLLSAWSMTSRDIWRLQPCRMLSRSMPKDHRRKKCQHRECLQSKQENWCMTMTESTAIKVFQQKLLQINVNQVLPDLKNLNRHSWKPAKRCQNLGLEQCFIQNYWL